MLTGYWLGPHGTLVPNTTPEAVCEDGFNTMSRDNPAATVYTCGAWPMRKDWLHEHAEKKDGILFYKCDMKRSERGYWTGPYGVLVPLELKRVPAEDGYNFRDQMGFITQVLVRQPFSKSEWLAQFTETVNDVWFYRTDRKKSPSRPTPKPKKRDFEFDLLMQLHELQKRSPSDEWTKTLDQWIDYTENSILDATATTTTTTTTTPKVHEKAKGVQLST